MDLQNLAYALDQVAHNFGVAAVVGGAAAALWLEREDSGLRRSLAWLVLVAWAMQAASGAAFGTISYHYYGEFPDIHGIADAALGIKVACAVASFGLFGLWRPLARRRPHLGLWEALLALDATALTAAAFLRWFS